MLKLNQGEVEFLLFSMVMRLLDFNDLILEGGDTATASVLLFVDACPSHGVVLQSFVLAKPEALVLYDRVAGTRLPKLHFEN